MIVMNVRSFNIGVQYRNNFYPLHYVHKCIVNLYLGLWQHKFIVDKHPCKSTKVSVLKFLNRQEFVASVGAQHKCIVQKQETLV